MAKDDVTPQDIFRLTKEGPNEKLLLRNIVFRIVT